MVICTIISSVSVNSFSIISISSPNKNVCVYVCTLVFSVWRALSVTRLLRHNIC